MNAGPCAVRFRSSGQGVKIGDTVNWSKLAAMRTMLLTLLGFLAIAGGAFLIYIPAGLITLGVALALLAYLTDTGQSAVRR